MVCQTYKNVEQNTIEAIYKFPFNEVAAVCGFEAEVDQGHGAYLLEEHIFQCSISNVMADQT
ncbi:15421_t:CDS:2, partial [Gigaspora rosea]